MCVSTGVFEGIHQLDLPSEVDCQFQRRTAELSLRVNVRPHRVLGEYPSNIRITGTASTVVQLFLERDEVAGVVARAVH